MTKKEAKIIAYRIAVGLLNGGVDEANEKVNQALFEIAAELEVRATKMGGEFNQFTGKAKPKQP